MGSILDGLGLDESAEAVYRAILVRKRWSVAEMADHLSRPVDQVRRIIEQLAELELVQLPDEPEETVLAEDPQVGLQTLLLRNAAELRYQHEQFEMNRAAVSGLLDEFADLYPAVDQKHIENLVGVDAIRERLVELSRSATRECLAFNPGGAQSESSLAASMPLDKEVISRGVSMRTVYLDSARTHAPTARYAHWLTELGGQVRTVPTLPLRMILIDGDTALLPVDPDNTRRGAIQLTTPGVTAALAALFEMVWAHAVPMGSEVEKPDGNELSRQEAEVLNLLAEGHTDAVVANRLGVSQRTVGRIASDLMSRLDARSRFQAGLRSAQQGWI
ncbi:LuxR C-terminal-related transcriptional regulator [Streptomyces sp. R21]|uniref:LuxR C-terminal-related transcriptional regulator n=1 Tax=Streptomyces sp. R21 TaxID=3238627 RepID=A0AB39PDU8_9ACTN